MQVRKSSYILKVEETLTAYRQPVFLLFFLNPNLKNNGLSSLILFDFFQDRRTDRRFLLAKVE